MDHRFARLAAPLTAGYLLDLLLADPENWPHPVRTYGKLIAVGEQQLNHGSYRFVKGAMLAGGLVGGTFFLFTLLDKAWEKAPPALGIAINSAWVFYGLANTGLVREGQAVFDVLERDGLEAGRHQLARIVGRDTAQLDAQQIRTAVLESLAENLSDGVVAPLFYYALAGVPGLMAYKMVNTLDSMVGYRNPRYELFGKFAARLDDVVNLVPARLTAGLLAALGWSKQGWRFILEYGHQHKSPNAGYPEAALAGVLDCRFGGPNYYHGQLVPKPYIGHNPRQLAYDEISRVARLNHSVCAVVVAGILGLFWWQLGRSKAGAYLLESSSCAIKAESSPQYRCM
ncbi:adenosylcobinamide-phosphate synthase CbiB [Hymenobacter sp.]|jgi:adenosylcobinamide-phosphate synthase|uniref:adenosylcobinamide-phosphate synthase CbiB n=1 Tax=Hymenobacter sp. TaxID=1898978 RepID=UPI002EDBA29A